MAGALRQEFAWGAIEWLAGAEAGNAKELSLARVSIAPGRATDVHRHANCEESIYVERGRVQCTLGAERAELSDGGQAVVPRGAVHAIRNVGTEPARLILSYSSAAREFELAGPLAQNSPARRRRREIHARGLDETVGVIRAVGGRIGRRRGKPDGDCEK